MYDVERTQKHGHHQHNRKRIGCHCASADETFRLHSHLNAFVLPDIIHASTSQALKYSPGRSTLLRVKTIKTQNLLNNYIHDQKTYQSYNLAQIILYADLCL